MDLLVWIGFLIVYAILQSLSKKKKKTANRPAQAPGTSQRPATLQDALREIQQALQQAQQPPPTREREPAPAPIQKTSKPVQRPIPEPEFHSLESTVYNSNLESKSRFEESYSSTNLEKEVTYDQKFPKTSSFSDDSYRHAHPGKPAGATKKRPAAKKPIKKQSLQALLKNKETLAQAFLLQEILGKPLARRAPGEGSRW